MRQPLSKAAEGWRESDPEIVVWALSPVEVVSAFFRLVRTGELTQAKALRAQELSLELFQECAIVDDVPSVSAVALRLLRTHPLRAADALQLGAAIVWAGGAPASRVFCTLDRKLGMAAELDGFRVMPSPR